MTSDTELPGAGPTLLGGEMTGWSDGVDPATALTEWVASVLEHTDGSVLLIGPRAATIARRVGARAVVLVRGTMDAARLHAEGATMRCGGLDRLPTGSGYDTVVLLDPPDRVLTPDSPGLGHLQLLDLASTCAAGRLIAYVPNALAGQPLPQGRASGDVSWWVGTPGYDDGPPVLADLREPASHLVLGDTVVLDSARATDPVVTTTVRAALPNLRGWLDVIRAGEQRQLATGWVVLRGRELPGLPAVFAPTLPAGLYVADSTGAPGTADTTDAVGEPLVGELLVGESLVGEPLEVLLVDALRCGDRARLRDLVVRYDDHLQDLPAELRRHAAPRTRIVTGDGAFVARVSAAGDPVAAPVAVAYGLWDLATLVAGTSQHPFAAEADAEAVAREVGMFADPLRLDEEVWRQARELRDAVALPTRHPMPAADGAAPEESGRVAHLESALRERQVKVENLQQLATRQERRIRAFEHAMATEHGPRARRALFVMTAPTSRLIEAARGRVRRSADRD